ncbi:MAG TPA: NAD-dependent epimerase/dehydratase family protein, partial [candidate division Zixibacteria bacterium]|nr:NAD-dependent epimerase/dehydratase family protein [candidate division Zixibacteria bacterium]
MTHRPQTVLVTGGAGYIGSVLVRVLLRAGLRVRTIDNLSWGGEALLGVLGD